MLRNPKKNNQLRAIIAAANIIAAAFEIITFSNSNGFVVRVCQILSDDIQWNDVKFVEKG